ncbi:MAG: sugar nucleotide-binding protein [Pseudohongiellaceae bacterium]
MSTGQYPTPAQRPKYSVLDLSLTKERYSIEPKPWKESLKRVIDRIADKEK